MREKYDRLEEIAIERPGSWTHAKRRVDGKPLTWLERDQASEGFELELPPPFQLFTSTVDGTRLNVSSKASMPLSDDIWERQKSAEERIAQEFGDNAVQVREWKTSVEIEMERLQSTLDEYCRGARAAMNAWMFLVLESLPEADASGKNTLEKYEGDMMRLRSQYRQDRGSSIEERLIDTGKYPGKTYVLNSLSEKYSARQMLRFESIIFWGHLVRPLTAEALRGEFSKLCTVFDVEPLIHETTLDGLLHYRGKIADQNEALLPLELERIVCEVRHTEIVRGVQPLWERQNEEARRLRGIYTGPAEDYWRHAYQLYRSPNELNTWKDVFYYMWEEQEDLGLPIKRHDTVESFCSSRTTYHSQQGDPLT